MTPVLMINKNLKKINDFSKKSIFGSFRYDVNQHFFLLYDLIDRYSSVVISFVLFISQCNAGPTCLHKVFKELFLGCSNFVCDLKWMNV